MFRFGLLNNRAFLKNTGDGCWLPTDLEELKAGEKKNILETSPSS